MPALRCSTLLLCALLGRAQEEGTCPAGDASCAPAESAQPYHWPQQKGDINRTGWSPFPAPFNLSGGPSWKWTDPHFQTNRHTPLIDDKRNIYLATVMGRIYKFSPEGEMIWEYNAKIKLPAVPSIMDGMLFFNTEYGYVVALDMETATVRWLTRISESTAGDTACVFAINGLVVSATKIGKVEVKGEGSNNAVVALHASNGSEAWVYRHHWPSFNFQASAPGDGSLVFQDRAGGLYRLDLTSGALLWQSGIADRDAGDFSTGAAVVGPNGLVYVASNYRKEGIIHAYRLADGAPVWRKEVGMEVNQAVAVARLAGSEGALSVVAGVGDNPLFPASLFLFWLLQPINALILCCCTCRCCCRACRCKRVFLCRSILTVVAIFALELPFLYGYHQASLALQDQPGFLFFVRDLRAAMVALDAETGAVRWSYSPPKYTKASAEGDEAMLLARLHKIHVEKDPGDPICLPDNWAQAVVDARGTTYGGHQDGHIYAIRDEDGSGSIEESEVSRYYTGACFQASQAIAPGMLVVVPCGGGMFVWNH